MSQGYFQKGPPFPLFFHHTFFFLFVLSLLCFGFYSLFFLPPCLRDYINTEARRYNGVNFQRCLPVSGTCRMMAIRVASEMGIFIRAVIYDQRPIQAEECRSNELRGSTSMAEPEDCITIFYVAIPARFAPSAVSQSWNFFSVRASHCFVFDFYPCSFYHPCLP